MLFLLQRPLSSIQITRCYRAASGELLRTLCTMLVVTSITAFWNSRYKFGGKYIEAISVCGDCSISPNDPRTMDTILTLETTHICFIYDASGKYLDIFSLYFSVMLATATIAASIVVHFLSVLFRSKMSGLLLFT